MAGVGTKGIYTAVYAWRRPLATAAYGMISALAYLGAYLLRFEFAVPPTYWRIFLLTLPLVVGVRLILAWTTRLTDGRWRYIGTVDLVRLVATTTAGTALLLLAAPVLPGGAIPRSVLLIEWVVTTQAMAAVWICYRLVFERMRQARGERRRAPRRVLIVGAGEAGSLLAREIQRNPTGYRLIGFVDDDVFKVGSRLQGAPVLGTVERISELARVRGAEEIILAVPSAAPDQLRRLVELCEESNVPFKVLPGIAEVLRGNVALNQLRALRIEDLLGREPVELELPELTADLRGRTVLITGAAGSIGSELSRQVALHHPETLVLFDQAETELFYLEMELRRSHPALRLVPVVGDITQPACVDRTFDRYRPDRVFHAAAYKHVPMLESNPEQAIENNVLGTYRVADAAGRFGAAKFVLVSTDKAVQPANIMGATKLLAELLVLQLQNRHPATSFGAVRFGNVLGSNGSVIPIFRRQIEEGRPLTVTHPDVTRYFMTIPEAVQLILQASLLPELRGHIAMLDMGEPVRILDLAKNFLRLSGVPVRVGQNIVFSGLRPGEKLHEELVAPGEEPLPTSVKKVRMLRHGVGTNIDALRLIRGWVGAEEPRRNPVGEVAELFDGLAPHRIERKLEVVVASATLQGTAA